MSNGPAAARTTTANPSNSRALHPLRLIPRRAGHSRAPPAGRVFHLKMLSEPAKEAMELLALQRLKLSRILLDLTEEDGDFSPQIEAAWDDEISRRLQAVQAAPARSRSFDQVFAGLDRRFQT